VNRRVQRRSMRELREYDQPYWQERRAPGDSGVDHGQHPIGVSSHLSAVERIGEIRLARGGGVSNGRHGLFPASARLLLIPLVCFRLKAEATDR
jgi:hypothetical protein